MQGFSALRFRAYAKDLEQAVLRLSRESMSVQDLKEALRDIPGASDLTVSYARNGDQVIHLAGKRVEVGPMASNDEIRTALQNPFVPRATTNMSVTGLQSGAFQSKLAEMRKRIANSQTAGLAKIDAVMSDGEKKLEAAAEGVAKQAQSEVDNALQEFATMTNGGPPLNG